MIDVSKKRVGEFLFLHITIFILALSFVASKWASIYMSQDGIFSISCIASLFVYFILTVVYAIAWQYNLEKFELSFLYTNRSFYMIWSQIFAVLIFKDELYLSNLIGLVLIFAGVWVNSKDA